MELSQARLTWHYRSWQRQLAGYMRTQGKNSLPNRNLIGYIINDKHPKTIKVQCERWMYSVRYQKTFRLSKKIWAHDEKNECHLGDVVKVQPLGHRIGPWKTYVLVEVLYREPIDVDVKSKDVDNELSDLEDDEVPHQLGHQKIKQQHQQNPKDYFMAMDQQSNEEHATTKGTGSSYFGRYGLTQRAKRGRPWMPFITRD